MSSASVSPVIALDSSSVIETGRRGARPEPPAAARSLAEAGSLGLLMESEARLSPVLRLALVLVAGATSPQSASRGRLCVPNSPS